LWFPSYSKRLQAIGSEVAAETSRSAEMKAPANMVALSRAEVKVVNIFIPLIQISHSNPTIGLVPLSMHGPCQLENIVLFQ
jgi:hypothetical protein